MTERRSDPERLVEVLNQTGIRTSIAGGLAPKDNLVSQAIRVTEEARKTADKEIARIAGNAKRPTSK
jgi:hypothetical protein